MMTLSLVPPAPPVSHDEGWRLANDLFDLIADRLPLLDPDDPLRPTLHQFLPPLGDALGRPRASLIGGDV